MSAKKGDVLFCEDYLVKYKDGGYTGIVVSMNRWQGGNPIRAEWSGDDIFIYTEKNWIYKIKDAKGSPSIVKSGK